jgi:hypothetical protein
MTIEDYDFPRDPESNDRLKKFVESGVIRVTGKLTELGYEPVMDVNVRKFADVIGKKLNG